MHYNDLHARYGARVARKIEAELTPAELDALSIRQLAEGLERRAIDASRRYQACLDNPFAREDWGHEYKTHIDALHKEWRAAEDIARLVNIAESANTQHPFRDAAE